MTIMLSPAIGYRTIIAFAVVTLCIVSGLFSQLDSATSLRQSLQTIRLPHIPYINPPEEPEPVEEAPPPPQKQEPYEIQALYEPSVEHHPIDDLIVQGEKRFQELLGQRSEGVKAAAEAYRRRRRRQPPPRFDEWVEFAEKRGAVVVEEFFDQIYHDLDPFWGLEPEELRKATRAWPCLISIREGNLTLQTDEPRSRMGLWADMVGQVAHLLPDLDIALNEMDEARVMAPWEDVNRRIQAAQQLFTAFPAKSDEQVLEFPQRYNSTHDPDLFEHGFRSDHPLWTLASPACPPDSPGRAVGPDADDYSTAPAFPAGAPSGSYHGYVGNWTSTRNPCVHAHLRNLHGSFIEPLSLAATTQLIPMFGGSKLPMGNDILLPAARYFTEDLMYKGSDKRYDWWEKQDVLVWRGSASGGRNKAQQWRRFQRHRMLSMLNGTQLRAAEVEAAAASGVGVDAAAVEGMFGHNFALPNLSIYDLGSQRDARLGTWMQEWSDARFVELRCFPPENRGPLCSYTDPFYETIEHTPTEEQYRYKYLPDVDGNSFSGRYRGFLRSYSLPIKATIYSEWHDARLVPYVHFVPMDNTFVDLPGIMEYFLGYDPARNSSSEGILGDDATSDMLRAAYAQQVGAPEQKSLRRPARDHVAHRIALEGHRWAERVLRKDDMVVYVYRLLLEWARATSESRERMGWVGDGVVFGAGGAADAKKPGGPPPPPAAPPKPDPPKPDPPKPDPPKPDPPKPEPPKPDAPKPDTAKKPDPPKPEPPKPEPPKPDAPKPDTAKKPDPPKPEPPKPDAPKPDTAKKPDPPKPEPPKPESPKTPEPPKPDAPKPDAPKPDKAKKPEGGNPAPTPPPAAPPAAPSKPEAAKPDAASKPVEANKPAGGPPAPPPAAPPPPGPPAGGA